MYLKFAFFPSHFNVLPMALDAFLFYMYKPSSLAGVMKLGTLNGYENANYHSPILITFIT